ncbi:hypothetical protein PMAYCL1PPCAC_01976 [Pristionchus mayeri]|uniref:ZP domain-containing protein n=1 Tax=Pristionchus mayeri TaxID=1317129 RepID=A0AAN4Z398_9BILA|nr:hypothetical protein PMAYCL1PPCAC_01976 [Pristionchus mayeri]
MCPKCLNHTVVSEDRSTMRAITLLITVASCLSRTAVAEDDVTTQDRIIVECSRDRMLIHLRRDFHLFSLKGNDPECKPLPRNFTEYDGNVIRVITWSLPLSDRDNGPCGLSFGQLKDSKLWVHSTTIFGPDHQRIAQCIKTGVLDKRGARIRVEQVTPEMKELGTGRGTVEVANRSTISAYFHHRFPQAAGLSLHPIQCWMINERRHTRKLVVDAGCPVLNEEKKAIVSLGSETASMVTGDHPHVFFNAESSLFEDEDPSDLPSFRLQCSVIPCKGADLHQQVIGVARCPSIAWCQTDQKKMTYQPTDAFEINQDFSFKISSVYSVPAKFYRRLGMAIYPGGYMAMDTEQRSHQKEAESSLLECTIFFVLVFVAFLLFILLVVCVFRRLMKNVVCKEEIQTYLRSLFNPKGTINDDCHPMKTSEPLFEDEQEYPV